MAPAPGGGLSPLHAAFLDGCEALLLGFDPLQARVACKKCASTVD